MVLPGRAGSLSGLSVVAGNAPVLPALPSAPNSTVYANMFSLFGLATGARPTASLDFHSEDVRGQKGKEETKSPLSR